LKKKVDVLKDVKRDLLCKATKVAESAIKYGAEVATSSDPLTAAVTISSKASAGASLSRFSASQCAGLVGVIVASFTPQVLYQVMKTVYVNN
jgi:hypothetical protein